MACHPAPPVSDEVLAFLDQRYMPLANAHDCCPKCSGLRCLAEPRCTETDCPLRVPVQLKDAA